MKDVAFSAIKEQALLDWIRDHDMLFSKKSSDYKDTVKKEVCWGEIALKMNWDSDKLKH